MNKKFIIVGVIILALSMLFVACNDPAQNEESTTVDVSSTAVDDNGAYVFNKDGKKVYLKDEQGFVRTPEEAYNSSPVGKEEGFFVGEGEGDSNASVNWEEIA